MIFDRLLLASLLLLTVVTLWAIHSDLLPQEPDRQFKPPPPVTFRD